ncbi:MAG: SusE domain-containing protein [Mucilaginibacter sp.]|uniref:SusE domain-containing protein n=1 Tax=Mucilaginibacter sp. L3T2-6 TaxID=3062491 RepID=UPI002675D621|nr:SusE domain-containing protein [Mucilaginibacter sp. L3T2-6]MDO3642781.1 SusE domain-containing protein [Mucilaginibacter sp. L3T2-6]MDV6215430.1 SusE domain-containing protein [Mucilaginibacter sp. L3T2-6]
MKTIFTKSLAIGSIALLMLASCKKDEMKVVATSGKAGTLQASSNAIVLTKADLDKTAVTFNFTSADFGYKAAVSNTLQIDAKSDNFAAPKEFVIGAGKLSQSFTTVDFNALMLALHLPTGSASDVSVRLKSQLSASLAPVYSNTMSITVTPFALVSYVYVPGAYQGWNPAVADSLTSAKGDGIYTGIILFTGADLGFKITTAKNWNNAYGDAGGGNVSLSGGNLTAPGDGSYQITLDENKNTIAFAYAQWSVIGDASPGGWGGDTDLKYNNTTNLWEGTVPLTAGGAIKFRFKHDWGVNLGGSNGTLTQGGDNISITATGNYKIVLDVVNNTYTLTKL